MGAKFGKMSLSHAGIHVRDMEETQKWYHDVFGFELVVPSFEKQYNMTGGTFPRCCSMRLGEDFELEIYEVPEALPFDFVTFEYTVGLKHLNISIENMHEWIEHIKELGVEIVVHNEYGPLCENNECVYVRDNSGMLIEVTNFMTKMPLYKDAPEVYEKGIQG